MSILLTRVDWYGDEGAAEPVKLEGVESITVRKGLDLKQNKCDIKIKNPFDRVVNSNDLNKYIDDAGNNKFKEGDIFKVYLANSDIIREIATGDTSSDLVFVAELTELSVDSTDNQSKITLKAVDKTYAMLNKLWAFNYDNSSSLSAPEIIQNVIRAVTPKRDDTEAYDGNGNKVYNGTWMIDARLTTGATAVNQSGDPPAFIQHLRPGDDSAFPVRTIAKSFKPAYEFIKDLSQIEYTHSTAELDAEPITVQCDRTMRFYVDELNRFHWFYPADGANTLLDGAISSSDTTITVDSTTGFAENGILQIDKEIMEYNGTTATEFTATRRGYLGTTAASHSDNSPVNNQVKIVEGDTTTGNEVRAFKLTKKTFDIINMVIFNAGKDLYGSGILSYFYNINTESKTLKMAYKPYTEISRDIIKAELPTGEGGNDNLVKDNTTPGPFTYEVNFYDNTAVYPFTTGWGVTSGATDATYNTALRDKAIEIGKSKASALTLSRGSPRWKGNMTLKGKKFTAGDLVNFTSYRAGIVNQDLRIKMVTHNVSAISWTTQLELEEDEERLGQ